MATEPESVSSPLRARMAEAIAQAGGWLGFDRFMTMALYEPGLGYYANSTPKFGHLPGDGSDFVTAPEISQLFGEMIGVFIVHAWQRHGTPDAVRLVEIGPGRGTMMDAVITATGARNVRTEDSWAVLPLEQLVQTPPALVALGFFGSSRDRVNAWSPSQHPALQRALLQDWC